MLSGCSEREGPYSRSPNAGEGPRRESAPPSDAVFVYWRPTAMHGHLILCRVVAAFLVGPLGVREAVSCRRRSGSEWTAPGCDEDEVLRGSLARGF